MNPVIFEVHGPYKISERKTSNGNVTLDVNDFWETNHLDSEFSGKRGCYVFAMKTSGGGLQPVYVGKATKTFKQEIFTNDKKHKYQAGYNEYSRGIPVMYFVVDPTHTQRGIDQIGEIEDFLIQAGAAKNPEKLQNIKGTSSPKWAISGVVRNRKRKTSSEKEFSLLFNIE